MARHFLYLTNTRLVAMTTRGKRIVSRREFAVSGAGVAEFEKYLAGMEPVPTHFFEDIADEDFRLDTVPHVGGGDRSAVIGRKLAQIFRNTPYRHAVMQGREAEGRRDDRVMYTAVTNPEALRPWIEILDRLQVPLEGIYSAAVFSTRLLEELDLEHTHTLLVTFTPGEALRQTYFRAREVKFSRLTPVDLEERQTLGAFVYEETLRTWQYLDSLRHFGPDDRLEVCMLVHAKHRDQVEPELRNFAQVQYHVIDIEQASMKLGLRTPPLGSTAEEVMVHTFLLRPVANHFASPELRRHALLRRGRLALRQASAVILAAGVAWGGWHVFQATQGADAEHRVEQQVAALENEHDLIVRSTPSLGVGGSTMRDTVAFYNGFVRSFPGLPEFVAPVSRVLAAHPQVRVTQLSWLAADDPKATPPLAGTSSRLAPPVKAVARGAESPPQPPPPDAAAGSAFVTGRYQIALLEAMLTVPVADFRRAMDEAQSLADDLARLPGMHAEVVESPLDVRSSQQLQGRLDASQPQAMEARFVLRLMRDRGGAA